MVPDMEREPEPTLIQKFLESKSPASGSLPKIMNMHYYGDLVRKLFLFGAVIMIVGLPFALNFLQLSLWQSLVAIVVLGLFAGLTTPSQTWVAIADLGISAVGLVYFEYYAVRAFETYRWGIFGINQLLGVVFVVALYYSTKSLRGALWDKN